MILRLFISIVPDFSGQSPRKLPTSSQEGRSGQVSGDSPIVPEEIASAIREYISLDVLKACVTSFHEPYFVEVQKELASLIATILVYYCPVTSTPQDVLVSLPNVNPAELERLAPYMSKPGSHLRQQRAIVMELLKDLKGVSVSEMGKMPKSSGFGQPDGRAKKQSRSKMAQGFMTAPDPSTAPRSGGLSTERRTTPDGLEGVSHLFRE
jgi:exportin-5